MDDKMYERTITVPKEVDTNPEYARQCLINTIYDVACLFYETIGEGKGLLMGNGHHMAQDLVKAAEEIWDKHTWNKK
jgi:hypothetical protein